MVKFLYETTMMVILVVACAGVLLCVWYLIDPASAGPVMVEVQNGIIAGADLLPHCSPGSAGWLNMGCH